MRPWTRAAALAVSAAALAGQSHVRAVRISLLQPAAEVAVAGGPWRTASAGQPLVEGMRMRTGPRERAEAELECGSALRLEHSSELDWTLLAADAKGARQTRARLLAGSLEATLYANDDRGFELDFAGARLGAAAGASVRVDLGDESAPSVAVLRGKATVSFGATVAALTKNKVLRLDANGRGAVAPATGPADDFALWAGRRDAVYRDALARARQQASADAGMNAEIQPATVTPPAPLPGQGEAPTTILNRANGGGIGSLNSSSPAPNPAASQTMLGGFFGHTGFDANGQPTGTESVLLPPPNCGG